MSNVATVTKDAKCLTPQSVCEKLNRKRSWLFARVKNDPDFPKPIYFSPKALVFLDVEINAWLSAQAVKSGRAALNF